MSDIASSKTQQQPKKPTQRRVRDSLFRIGRTGLITYLAILLGLLFMENSLIFPVRQYPQGNWNPVGLNQEDVYFKSVDGTKLHGWYFKHPNPRAVVLYCHGNGGHVADYAGMMRAFRDEYELSVFVFDYRGYGRSQGKPNEAGVTADTRAAHRWLLNRTGIEPNQIVLIGQSLGGALAVDLATEHGTRGLVLERTFTKMPDVAANQYPWLPVRWLMRTQLDSLSKINAYQGPLLQSHGTADNIVPLALAKKLYNACPSGQKYFFHVAGGGHNDAQPGEYWAELRKFLWNLP